jgi:hypothetical protein
MRREVIGGLGFGLVFWAAHYLMTFAERGGEVPVGGLIFRLAVPPAAACLIVLFVLDGASWVRRMATGWLVLTLGTFLLGFGVFFVLCARRAAGSIPDNAFCALVALGSMLISSGMAVTFVLSLAVVPGAVALALRRARGTPATNA